MVCQYPTPGPVSSEKHGTAPDAGAQEGHGDAATTPQVQGVVGRDRAVPESLTAMTWRAKSAIALRFRTCGRRYFCEALLQGLAEDPQDVAAELRQFIQTENPVVRPRYLAGPRHLAPPIRPTSEIV